MHRHELRAWGLAAALYLPMAAIVLVHLCVVPTGLWPTGFLQADQVGYAAMAREHFDAGFGFAFGLPFSSDPQTPRIYFSPLLLLYGLIVQWTGWDPGRVFLALGALAGVAFLRVAIALLGARLGTGPRWWQALLFCWGGGLLSAAGALAGIAKSDYSMQSLFRFDPENGGWFLNLGRNLSYSTESVYHLLSIGALLAILRRRFGVALLVLALLAACHPFTGLQFLVIALAYAGLEQVLRSPSRPPLWFGAGAALLLAAHLYYHMVYLPQFAEHRSVMTQWALNWVLDVVAILLAYLIVGAAAVHWLRRHGFERPDTRLLTVVLVISLLLANHELFMAPRQPLHFTRGYIWTPLFLIGAASLFAALERLWASRRAFVRALAPAFCLLFLFDNASFFGARIWSFAQGHDALYLDPDERAALAGLNDPSLRGSLLVTPDTLLAYLALTYTPLQAQASWFFTTPFMSERQAELARWVANGEEPAGWRSRAVVFLALADSDVGRRLLAQPGARHIAGYVLLPRPASP